MNLELKNKKVLITGSSKGIGLSIAVHFLNEGADVILVSRKSELLGKVVTNLTNEFGQNRVWSETCDCTDSKLVNQLQNNIFERFGSIDIVISNVGDGRSSNEPVTEYEQWKQVWDTNFESALYTARAFLPMLEKSSGVLLFISSIAALEAFGAPVDYSTAKSAIIALSKNISHKVSKNVRVNVIAPGNIYFEGGSWEKKMKQNPIKVNNMLKKNVPLNRFGTPDEIADAAIFICSDRAKFITGAVLVVDGGQTLGVF